MVKRKKAFSLVEALVATTILVIVLVLATTISTKKTPEENVSLNSYRCFCAYKTDETGTTTLTRQSYYISNGRIINDDYNTSDDTCVFYPPSSPNLYSITVLNELSANNASQTDDESSNNNFAAVNFPKKEVKIKLGNSENYDISVEDVLTTKMTPEARCYNNMTKEECNSDESGNVMWLSGLCIVNILNQNECEENGNNWLSDGEISNPCILGTNVEINW